MSDTQWYYADPQRQRHGPLSTEQLRALLVQGDIDVDTLVWRQGMPHWQPLQQVTDPMGVLSPVPAADPDLDAGTPGAYTPLPATGSAAASANDPYAAPASSIGAAPHVATAPGLPDTLRPYAAFVGPNFETYRRKWRLDHGTDGAGTWNWPAFLFGAVWMAYRRMYGVSALWAGALAISSVIESYFGFSQGLSTILTFGASIAAGVCGNLLYLRHTQRRIAQISPAYKGRDIALQAELAARGGTRWSAVAVFILIYVAVLGLMAFVFEV